jgi:IS30 family transposase
MHGSPEEGWDIETDRGPGAPAGRSGRSDEAPPMGGDRKKTMPRGHCCGTVVPMKTKQKLAGRDNSRTKRKPFKHFSETDRIRLETLIRTEYKKYRKPNFTWLSKELGFHRTTIMREYERGLVVNLDSELRERHTYSVEKARQDRCAKAAEKGPVSKLTNVVADALRRKILDDKLSPYAAVEMLKREGELPWVPSERYVYYAIDSGLLGISRSDLPYKRTRKRRGKSPRMAYNNARGRPICERPREADERSEAGHFEGDLVMGRKGTKACVLTLVDRYSRFQLSIILPDATRKSVEWGLSRLEKEHPEVFRTMKTITFDNGTEFLNFKALEWSCRLRKKRCDIFYARAYRASDRPSNENSNRILRRFIPKGTDISKITQSGIRKIQDWMNNLPRKILGGKTAEERMWEYIKDKTA